MERYIDKLKQFEQPNATILPSLKEQKEKVETQNPCVVCCVTMGKELHAGHLFLLTIGEQMRNALDSKNPLTLINNNTGPRAAGALLNIASDQKIMIEEAVELLDQGVFDTSMIVRAYRSRREDASDLDKAVTLLSSNKYDIFSRVSTETKSLLTKSGFFVELVPESTLLESSLKRTMVLAPEWMESGFLPFTDKKRIVVLQKGGGLTATGTLFTAISAISEITKSDLILTVDSMPDAADASFVFSATCSSGMAAQVPGAGVGFEGGIASGTKGEALTIREISEMFLKERPAGNLKDAALFLTLTRPVSLPVINSSNLTESFYDFKNNQSLVDLLIVCSDNLLQYRQNLQNEIVVLQEKVVEPPSSTASISAAKLLEFLPQKSQALFKTDLGRILSNSRKVDQIDDQEQIRIFSKEFGYEIDENNPYLSAKRCFGIRRNFYFNFLNGLMGTTKDINTLKKDEYVEIIRMIQFCRERLGI